MKKLVCAIAVVSLRSACKFNSSNNKTLPIHGNKEPVTKTVDGNTTTTKYSGHEFKPGEI